MVGVRFFAILPTLAMTRRLSLWAILNKLTKINSVNIEYLIASVYSYKVTKKSTLLAFQFIF
jgi:hypothetical protein